MKKPIIAPSVLSANFFDLKSEIKRCDEAGIKWIHYDVMDFDFVPNLTFGSKILKDITDNSKINIDIHFMVKVKTKNFEDFFVDYIKCKPKMMTMHIESMSKKQTNLFIDMCIKNKIDPSIAISPKTKVKKIVDFLPNIKNVLVMSVEPGFGGQKFIESVLPKFDELNKIKSEQNLNFKLEIDGGIDDQTIKLVKEKNVDMVVAGSYLFNSKNFSERVDGLIND
ncbi:ribulose-phosphate 3-epimerase [Mesoplasma photuris]|uniref:ribulose-phosphate 3-epimerase n=1 Tax=Mesoplasma photuris TaxID=217731 RepID=UPI0004E1964A|nr:ribulose-phosphate 3-epimerase [Mesoplasma photuris]